MSDLLRQLDGQTLSCVRRNVPMSRGDIRVSVTALLVATLSMPHIYAILKVWE